jgi:hypothetical protein
LPVKTLLFGSTPFKHGSHFHYWNQPLNMRMRVCYLDCHEAGLCCYLVIHTENLWRPLQLFYSHLWLIYWLSLVYTYWHDGIVISLIWSWAVVTSGYPQQRR